MTNTSTNKATNKAGKFDNGLFLWLGCEVCGVIQQYADSYATWKAELTEAGLVFLCPGCVAKKEKRRPRKK